MLQFIKLKQKEIFHQLEAYHDAGMRVFASSSFQTQSLPLLHMLSRCEFYIEIVFLDTGYHFPETLAFRDEVVQLFRLRVTSVRSVVPKSEQRTSDGRLLFAADPGRCCYLNKVAPLEPYLRSHDVWVSGVRSDQSKVRATLTKTSSGPFGITRYHPMIDWTANEITAYRSYFELPEHPLEAKGYPSVGCVPCTRPREEPILESEKGQDRRGRWVGQTKTECGLHTELARQESAER